MNGPATRGGLSASETPATAVRSASRRSISTASRQPCEALVSSSDSAPPARSDSRPLAARSAAGPPCRTVSAAVTVTTRSVSTSARLTRSCTLPARPRSTRSSASASWTITRPRKRRRNSGGTSRPISRGAVRRRRPPATRIVTCCTPRRSSSSDTVAIASWRGPNWTPGSAATAARSRSWPCRPAGRAARAGGRRAGRRVRREPQQRRPRAGSVRPSVAEGRRRHPTSATTMRASARSGTRVTCCGAPPPRRARVR